jgi:hypothetical protein
MQGYYWRTNVTDIALVVLVQLKVSSCDQPKFLQLAISKSI